MNGKLSTLAMRLPEKADAALIYSETNRRYFTGFASSLGYLLVTRTDAFLMVDSRYEEDAVRQVCVCHVVPFKKLSETLSDLITTNKLKNIMLEGSGFTLNEAEKTEKIFRSCGATAIKSGELDDLIDRQRCIKTEDEIERMRKAQRITEEAFRETLGLIRYGVSERDLALELEFRMRRSGAEGVSFDLIVLTGARTSMPHGVPGYSRVDHGDLVLFDIGATFEGYHSDMTRTVCFGKLDGKRRRIYDTVLKAHKLGMEAVRDGVTCGEVDKACRSYIEGAGYGEYFGHSTGHGVGMDIHETPSVSPGSSFVLRSGMVITVEPGVYIPRVGGVRIEDMVVVTPKGCISLAASPKELIEL